MDNYQILRSTINYNRFPNFLIIGANKGGTTSIHNYCSQHPDIMVSKIKEPMFFTAPDRAKLKSNPSGKLGDPVFVSDIDNYQKMFIGGAKYKARGEASTAYLASPYRAISKIKAFKPNMKIIACLREPVDRSISAYNMYHGAGLENRTFTQCVEDELSHESQKTYKRRPYLRMSKYLNSIKMYIHNFGKRQVLVQDFEFLKSDPEKFMKNIFQFLQLDENVRISYKKLNTSDKWLKDSKKITKDSIPPETLARCEEFLNEDYRQVKLFLKELYPDQFKESVVL